MKQYLILNLHKLSEDWPSFTVSKVFEDYGLWIAKRAEAFEVSQNWDRLNILKLDQHKKDLNQILGYSEDFKSATDSQVIILPYSAILWCFLLKSF